MTNQNDSSDQKIETVEHDKSSILSASRVSFFSAARSLLDSIVRGIKKLDSFRRTLLFLLIFCTIIYLTFFNATEFESIVLPAVLFGVVANVATILLIEGTLRRDLTTFVANSVAEEVVRVASDKINEAPSRIFIGIGQPDPEFTRTFFDNYSKSNTYEFYGATASFALLRLLADLAGEPTARGGTEVKFAILDPLAEEQVRDHAQASIREESDPTGISIEEEIAKLQHRILVSIVLARKIKDSHRIKLALHKNFVFYRSESLSNGLFISYYNGGRAFKDNLLFKEDTRTYAAYRNHFRSEFEYWGASNSSQYGDLLGMNEEKLCEKFGITEVVLDNLKSDVENRVRQYRTGASFDVLMRGERS